DQPSAARTFCIDRGHVRGVGHCRHRAGDAHRPGDGIHEMSEAVLEALDVVKFLGHGAGEVQALRGVSLSLQGGELTLLMGPSGSGKTTLLSVLGCLMAPTRGTVRVRGQSIDGVAPEEIGRASSRERV